MSTARPERSSVPASRRRSVIAAWLGVIGSAGLAASLILAASATATRAVDGACSPSTSILESPRAGSKEVQAKALNDRGDIVGFADSTDGTIHHAILWKGGKAAGAVDLGVLPGYVASEAYGVNNNRVVFGLLYDKKERTFPFRWEAGRMTVLKGPNGRRQQADVPDRNTINERGEMAGTLLIAGQRQAVRWSPDGKATLLPALPGHTWTNVWSINGDGVVSGWSRKMPNDDGENNPVIWDAAGKVVALQTAPGRADGAAEATNRSGLTVGYLGNLGTDADPERGNAVVWQSRTASAAPAGAPRARLRHRRARGRQRPRPGGRHDRHLHEERVPAVRPAIWRTGWTSLGRSRSRRRHGRAGWSSPT